MAETKITSDNSGSQVRHSNPATHILSVSAGQPMTATVKLPGNSNAAVHGQIPGAAVSIVFDNPS